MNEIDVRLRAMEPMWTSERDQWLLICTPPMDGPLAVRREGNMALIIEDDELAVEVVRRMTEAGVEVRETLPGAETP